MHSPARHLSEGAVNFFKWHLREIGANALEESRVMGVFVHPDFRRELSEQLERGELELARLLSYPSRERHLIPGYNVANILRLIGEHWDEVIVGLFCDINDMRDESYDEDLLSIITASYELQVTYSRLAVMNYAIPMSESDRVRDILKDHVKEVFLENHAAFQKSTTEWLCRVTEGKVVEKLSLESTELEWGEMSSFFEHKTQLCELMISNPVMTRIDIVALSKYINRIDRVNVYDLSEQSLMFLSEIGRDASNVTIFNPRYYYELLMLKEELKSEVKISKDYSVEEDE